MHRHEKDNKLERYETLLHDFARHIYGFCYSHTQGDDEARQLVQEVMEDVWNGLDGLQATTARQTNRWIQQLMHNALAAHHRSKQSIVMLPLESAGQVADESDDKAELLHELVTHLPLGDQMLVNRRLEGYSAAEIAESERVSVDVVNHRMMRIKHKLKTIFDKFYGEEQR